MKNKKYVYVIENQVDIEYSYVCGVYADINKARLIIAKQKYPDTYYINKVRVGKFYTATESPKRVRFEHLESNRQ